MSIYQFLIAVRQQDGQMLMNESGDVTSYVSLDPAGDVAPMYQRLLLVHIKLTEQASDGVLLSDDTNGRSWD